MCLVILRRDTDKSIGRQRQKACLPRNRLCDFTSGHKTKRQQYENFIVLNGLEVELMALIRLSEKKVQRYHYLLFQKVAFSGEKATTRFGDRAQSFVLVSGNHNILEEIR